VLAEAGEPLAFSTLFERSEYDTSANFSYHLGELEGHFISRAEEGYGLRQAGRRVVEAVIAGTMTEDPVVERAPTDRPCPFCSAPIEVSYRQERIEMYCSECPGVGRGQDEPAGQFDTEFGTLGHISLPPAGVQGRTPTEMIRAAQAWDNLDLLGGSAWVCSRCSGTVEHSVTVCEDHDGSGASAITATVGTRCCSAACPNSKSGIAIVCLLAKTEMLSFVTEHGGNPLMPDTYDVEPGALANYGEEILSFDPFRVELTFTIEGDSLTLRIDEDVSIVDVTRDRGTESV
jgi:hypothetical protein